MHTLLSQCYKAWLGVLGYMHAISLYYSLVSRLPNLFQHMRVKQIRGGVGMRQHLSTCMDHMT